MIFGNCISFTPSSIDRPTGRQLKLKGLGLLESLGADGLPVGIALACPEFVPEITGGQSTLLGGRACPEVAFLRELKGNCVSFW